MHGARFTRGMSRCTESVHSLVAMRVLANLQLDGPLRVGELAAREHITQPTMTTVINRLAEHGLVAKGTDPDDARVSMVSLTQAGIDELYAFRTRASAELEATPTEAMLLLTSYLVITAIAMFFTGAISSRWGVKRTLLAGLTLIVVFAALAGASAPVLITVVIVAGLFLGVLNTALTETVMEATDLPRSVASSTYSGVRFLGGAIAPAVSGGIAAWLGDGAPYWFGVGALVAAGVVLALGGHRLAHVGRAHVALHSPTEAEAITAGDEG